MAFHLLEIPGGQTGRGPTFKAAVRNAVHDAAVGHRVFATELTPGTYNLSRPQLAQKVTVAVRSPKEAVLSQVFPGRRLEGYTGSLAIQANTFQFQTLELPPWEGTVESLYWPICGPAVYTRDFVAATLFMIINGENI